MHYNRVLCERSMLGMASLYTGLQVIIHKCNDTLASSHHLRGDPPLERARHPLRLSREVCLPYGGQGVLSWMPMKFMHFVIA